MKYHLFFYSKYTTACKITKHNTNTTNPNIVVYKRLPRWSPEDLMHVYVDNVPVRQSDCIIALYYVSSSSESLNFNCIRKHILKFDNI